MPKIIIDIPKEKLSIPLSKDLKEIEKVLERVTSLLVSDQCFSDMKLVCKEMEKLLSKEYYYEETYSHCTTTYEL